MAKFKVGDKVFYFSPDDENEYTEPFDVVEVEKEDFGILTKYTISDGNIFIYCAEYDLESAEHS